MTKTIPKIHSGTKTENYFDLQTFWQEATDRTKDNDDDDDSDDDDNSDDDDDDDDDDDNMNRICRKMTTNEANVVSLNTQQVFLNESKQFFRLGRRAICR